MCILIRPYMMPFQSCDLKYVGQAFHGNQTATASDWELLRRITRRFCRGSNNKNRSPRRG